MTPEQEARYRRIAAHYPAAVVEALTDETITERRLVGLILAWGTVPAVAAGLRSALRRMSRGAFEEAY